MNLLHQTLWHTHEEQGCHTSPLNTYWWFNKTGAEIFLELSRIGAFSDSWQVLDLNPLTTIHKSRSFNKTTGDCWQLVGMYLCFPSMQSWAVFPVERKGLYLLSKYHTQAKTMSVHLQGCPAYLSLTLSSCGRTTGLTIPLKIPLFCQSNENQNKFMAGLVPTEQHCAPTTPHILGNNSVRKTLFLFLKYTSVLLKILKSVSFLFWHSNFAIATATEDLQIEFNALWMEHNPVDHITR